MVDLAPWRAACQAATRTQAGGAMTTACPTACALALRRASFAPTMPTSPCPSPPCPAPRQGPSWGVHGGAQAAAMRRSPATSEALGLQHLRSVRAVLPPFGMNNPGEGLGAGCLETVRRGTRY